LPSWLVQPELRHAIYEPVDARAVVVDVDRHDHPLLESV
jgi:hypothetical protein